MHLPVPHLGQKFAPSSTAHPQFEQNMAGRMAGRKTQEDTGIGTRMPCGHLTARTHVSLVTKLYDSV